eukprot:CAMPEP_0113316912 /NCGR_PEP_ID=MMETSP0010_2-20120614/12010_1 /TAXON_ID=216773 ORGANISM="Corethron hystrix, Strain 308" /NCGR_SAMPLE_ID=MMETSP0010_2 /ASSEMBLY_ACC=CAM_ASM_000155 /LENGTH=225 /DNA_ID=CAMNT_0000173747 /DNA_START=86 /DNA_END=760 /DNA_ORIENTATION=+ /assembly_acc=CAM_ASM_000155
MDSSLDHDISSSSNPEPCDMVATYLSSLAPKLGIDEETFFPYILSVLDDYDPNEPECHDNVSAMIEVLRASSEKDDVEDSDWEDFERRLVEMYQESKQKQTEQKEEETARRLEKERLLRIQTAEEADRHFQQFTADASRSENGSTIEKEIEVTRRMIAERFAYDCDEAEEDVRAPPSETAQTSEKVKMVQQPSKLDQRKGTKVDRDRKEKAKEARRARAQKGERR